MKSKFTGKNENSIGKIYFWNANLSSRDIVARDLKLILRSIKLSEQGVFVQASTLGSLEALLEFLKTSKIPVSFLTFKHFQILINRYWSDKSVVCLPVNVNSMTTIRLSIFSLRTLLNIAHFRENFGRKLRRMREI